MSLRSWGCQATSKAVAANAKIFQKRITAACVASMCTQRRCTMSVAILPEADLLKESFVKFVKSRFTQGTFYKVFQKLYWFPVWKSNFLASQLGVYLVWARSLSTADLFKETFKKSFRNFIDSFYGNAIVWFHSSGKYLVWARSLVQTELLKESFV